MQVQPLNNSSVQEEDAAPVLTSDRKRDLLIEWRAALAAIVERDPNATETRRTIGEIDEQIASLGQRQNS